jgi:hypothetical protein
MDTAHRHPPRLGRSLPLLGETLVLILKREAEKMNL